MASLDHSPEEIQLSDFKIPPSARMTEEEFVAWCDEDTRTEWVDGDVVMMAPANYEHTKTSHWLASVMTSFAEHFDLGEVLPDFQIRLGNQRRRRGPDISFVSKERKEIIQRTHVEGAPDLAVEVVSPDSVARDWREKYLEYEAAGVREYWVVDPMVQRVEAYALTQFSASEGATPSPRYRRIEEKQGIITSTVLPGFAIQTAWLWPETRPTTLEALRQLSVLGAGE